MTGERPLRAYAEVMLGRQRSPIHEDGPFMVRYLRAANVKDGYLDLDSVYEMNFTPDEQRIFGLSSGDVLVTEGSGSLGSVGASAVWSGELSGTVCFQNTLLRLRPRPGTDPRFLAWWCRYAFADGLFASVASGANIFHLSAERVRELPMAAVEPARQPAIADFLDAETARIDALIQTKDSLLSVLEQRALAALDQLLSPSSVPLRRFATIQSGLTVDSGRIDANRKAYPYLRVANVQDGWLDLREVTTIEIAPAVAKRATLMPGDVLMTEANGNPNNLGRGAVWHGKIDGCLHQNHIFATRVDQSRLIPKYLALLTRSRYGREYFAMVSSQVGIATISRQKILDFPIPLLSVEEQDRRLNVVERQLVALEAASMSIKRQLMLLHEHRKALITAAVTGEFDIPSTA